MGKSSLILVILLSTIFAGIAIRMQNRMLDLPDVLRDDQIKRETENVSDYALRWAIAYAVPRVKNWVGDHYDTVTLYFDGTTSQEDNIYHYPHFPVGNGLIRQITFNHIGGVFTGPNKEIRFQAVSSVRGRMQGKTVNYPAEIAFNFFKVDTPDCFYFEMDQPQLEGHAKMIDTSGKNNHAYPFNGLHTFPTPGDGVAGWKCSFWHKDFNDAAYAPNDDVNHSMEVSEEFTLVCFAKLDRNLAHRNAALVWLPSTVPQSGHSGTPPASAIWYCGSDGCIHFTVGLGGTGGTGWLEVKFPYKDKLEAYSPGNSGQGYRNFPWEFFALTFNRGVLMAYYNGRPAVIPGNPAFGGSSYARTSRYGVSVGSKITKVAGSPSNEFSGSEFTDCFCGVMDQVGMFSRALTPDEIWDFYTLTQMPTKVDYIRD